MNPEKSIIEKSEFQHKYNMFLNFTRLKNDCDCNEDTNVYFPIQKWFELLVEKRKIRINASLLWKNMKPSLDILLEKSIKIAKQYYESIKLKDTSFVEWMLDSGYRELLLEYPVLLDQISNILVEFIDLIEGTTEYYDKKIEKCLTNTTIKELVVGSEHHLLQAARNMIIDDEQFIVESKKIAQDLFAVSKYVEEMPNSNLMFVGCKVDGEKMILIMKLNYKVTPISIVEEVDGKRFIKFVNRQSLPPKTSAVEEAIIINVDKNTVSLIEKRFQIDGKPGYYLNEQYIKGEPKLTDKQKMSIVNKVVKKVDSEYNVFEGDPTAMVKKEMIDLVMEHLPLKPMEIAKKVMGDDYNAQEEVETIMRDLGIEEDDEIVNVPLSLDRMSRCKLVLDDDRIIELNVEDYLNHENITTETDMSGYSTITLNNIKDIKIK